MWDLLYLIDASSSMAEVHKAPTGRSFVKIDLVKESLGDLLAAGAFPFGSKLGVVTFQVPTKAGGLLLAGGEMVKVVLPMTATDGLSRETLNAKLSTIQVSGATPSGLAIEEGLKQIYALDDGRIRRIKKLVMITDERSNVGPKPKQVVNEEVAVRAIIDVIAIGGKINRETLEKVAAKTGGRFTVVEGADDLKDAMKPKIEMRGFGVDAGLLEAATKAAKELEHTRAGGTSSMEHRQALDVARQVRAKANKRLMEVLMLKSQSEAEVTTLASQVATGLPMHEYAKRVWPRAAELEQVAKVESQLRGAMDRLAF